MLGCHGGPDNGMMQWGLMRADTQEGWSAGGQCQHMVYAVNPQPPAPSAPRLTVVVVI